MSLTSISCIIKFIYLSSSSSLQNNVPITCLSLLKCRRLPHPSRSFNSLFSTSRHAKVYTVRVLTCHYVVIYRHTYIGRGQTGSLVAGRVGVGSHGGPAQWCEGHVTSARLTFNCRNLIVWHASPCFLSTTKLSQWQSKPLFVFSSKMKEGKLRGFICEIKNGSRLKLASFPPLWPNHFVVWRRRSSANLFLATFAA